VEGLFVKGSQRERVWRIGRQEDMKLGEEEGVGECQYLFGSDFGGGES